MIKHPLSYFMHSACGSQKRFSSREPGHHRRTDPRSAMRRGDGTAEDVDHRRAWMLCDARDPLVCKLMTLCRRYFTLFHHTLHTFDVFDIVILASFNYVEYSAVSALRVL